jgi:RNA polymerase sigma factor (TIGR02999 family)
MTAMQPNVTLLLKDLASGDPTAREQLWRTLYHELRSMAAGLLAKEKPGQTLQPTALIHEAYLKLLGGNAAFSNRRYFFAAAAQAMRRILVDIARRKQSLKAGGDIEQAPWEEPAWTANLPPDEVLAIHEALERLQAEDAIAAEIVNLHFFAGFSLDETAEVLDISRATVYRSWTYAKAWLRDALE